MGNKARKPEAVRQHRQGQNVMRVTSRILAHGRPAVDSRLTARQCRALEALLVRSLTVAELRREAGVSNASDLVGTLIRRGFNIVSIPMEGVDRDGERFRTVRYELLRSSRRAAEKALS